MNDGDEHGKRGRLCRFAQIKKNIIIIIKIAVLIHIGNRPIIISIIFAVFLNVNVMVKCIIIAKIMDDSSLWEESFVTYLESLSFSLVRSYLEDIISRFNVSLSPYESPRTLVDIISFRECS